MPTGTPLRLVSSWLVCATCLLTSVINFPELWRKRSSLTTQTQRKQLWTDLRGMHTFPPPDEPLSPSSERLYTWAIKKTGVVIKVHRRPREMTAFPRHVLLLCLERVDNCNKYEKTLLSCVYFWLVLLKPHVYNLTFTENITKYMTDQYKPVQKYRSFHIR